MKVMFRRSIFWSVVVYDPDTRSMLKTDNPFPSLNTYTRGLEGDDKKGYTLYFGPTLPNGVHRANWIRADPDKGWFTILRFYGPTQEYFDKTWIPGDIEEVTQTEL